MRLPRFLSKFLPGFQIIDLKEWLNRGEIDIHVKEESSERFCSRCDTKLGASHGKYPVKIRTMPVFHMKAYIKLFRYRGFCSTCNKVRSQRIDFIANETPHLTRDYAWWLGRLCEISPVSRAAEFSGHDDATMYRLDFNRLIRLFQNYKIPKVSKISVDEVYARKKKYYKKESRNKRFFTVITCLESRRVVWVSESRDKKALDEFFQIIGPDRCKDIEVVAADQHDPYKASVNEYCPQATFVWDRFHVMQTFQMAVDDDRKWIHRYMAEGEIKRLTRGKYKSLFLKKAGRRNDVENRHIKDVLKDNEYFAYLELIKESMFEVYESASAEEARAKFDQIGKWIEQGRHFYSLEKWWKNLNLGWDTFKNYFKYKVTSSLSEGINNVIKTVKKRAYGYRNMVYFRLKILQVCGFLNSRYIPMEF